jgi:hypothetical protein
MAVNHKQCNRLRSQSYGRCVCGGGGGELAYNQEYKGSGVIALASVGIK